MSVAAERFIDAGIEILILVFVFLGLEGGHISTRLGIVIALLCVMTGFYWRRRQARLDRKGQPDPPRERVTGRELLRREIDAGTVKTYPWEEPHRQRLVDAGLRRSIGGSPKEWRRLSARFERLHDSIVAKDLGLAQLPRALRRDEPGAKWEIRGFDPEDVKDARALCANAGSLVPAKTDDADNVERWLNYLMVLGEGCPDDSRMTTTTTINGEKKQTVWDSIDDLLRASLRGCEHALAESQALSS